ncbi:MAG: hypothetical protein Sylvanvirus7_5 [Sylvanvirus sp.]|uniref:Uncharacterized protein n=1 Tax=Sylvanvirus sp. TaxID=2487774 RepID=A0A3G5AHN2_9VIRU|nr:MAG: hypothetical protein Sylvanvirus7_5 [Sylvanvirus sp.]
MDNAFKYMVSQYLSSETIRLIHEIDVKEKEHDKKHLARSWISSLKERKERNAFTYTNLNSISEPAPYLCPPPSSVTFKDGNFNHFSFQTLMKRHSNAYSLEFIGCFFLRPAPNSFAFSTTLQYLHLDIHVTSGNIVQPCSVLYLMNEDYNTSAFPHMRDVRLDFSFLSLLSHCTNSLRYLAILNVREIYLSANRDSVSIPSSFVDTFTSMLSRFKLLQVEILSTRSSQYTDIPCCQYLYMALCTIIQPFFQHARRPNIRDQMEFFQSPLSPIYSWWIPYNESCTSIFYCQFRPSGHTSLSVGPLYFFQNGRTIPWLSYVRHLRLIDPSTIDFPHLQKFITSLSNVETICFHGMNGLCFELLYNSSRMWECSFKHSISSSVFLLFPSKFKSIKSIEFIVAANNGRFSTPITLSKAHQFAKSIVNSMSSTLTYSIMMYPDSSSMYTGGL